MRELNCEEIESVSGASDVNAIGVTLEETPDGPRATYTVFTALPEEPKYVLLPILPVLA